MKERQYKKPIYKRIWFIILMIIMSLIIIASIILPTYYVLSRNAKIGSFRITNVGKYYDDDKYEYSSYNEYSLYNYEVPLRNTKEIAPLKISGTYEVEVLYESETDYRIAIYATSVDIYTSDNDNLILGGGYEASYSFSFGELFIEYISIDGNISKYLLGENYRKYISYTSWNASNETQKDLIIEKNAMTILYESTERTIGWDALLTADDIYSKTKYYIAEQEPVPEPESIRNIIDEEEYTEIIIEEGGYYFSDDDPLYNTKFFEYRPEELKYENSLYIK